MSRLSNNDFSHSWSFTLLMLLTVLVCDCFIFSTVLYPSIIRIRRITHTLRSGKKTKGYIVDYIKDADLDQRSTYQAIIEFRAADGEIYRIILDNIQYIKPTAKKRFSVCYLEASPEDAVVNPLQSLCLLVLSSICITFIVGAFTIIFLLQYIG